MTDMIERVASAICEHQGRSWGAADANVHDRWRDMARAAIEAMREPTIGMLESGSYRGGYDAYRNREHTPDIWQAMIDAALSEKGEG